MPEWKKSGPRALALTLVGILLAGLAACGSSDAAAPTESAGGACADIPDGPIKIGSILPLSGAFAALGASNDKGTEIAIKAFNENTDICGHKIERAREDDKGDPATAVSLGRKLVSDGVAVFVDAGRGQTGDALTPYLTKAGAIIISDAGFDYRAVPADFPTYFSVNPQNKQYIAKTAANITAQGWRKVGILTDGLTSGNELTPQLTALLEADGNPVVKTVTYSPTAIDLSAQLQELKGAGVETLMLAGTSNITNIVASLKTAGWAPHLAGIGLLFAYGVDPADVPEGTTDLCYLHLPKGQAPDGTEGLSPLTVNLLEQGATALGEFNPSISITQEAYSRLLVAKAAIEKAGSLDLAKLKTAMESLQNVPSAWPGISYSFSPDDHVGYPDDQLSVCKLDKQRLSIRYEAQ